MKKSKFLGCYFLFLISFAQSANFSSSLQVVKFDPSKLSLAEIDPVTGDNLCQLSTLLLWSLEFQKQEGRKLSPEQKRYIYLAHLYTQYNRPAVQRPRFVKPQEFNQNLVTLGQEPVSNSLAKKMIRSLRQELSDLQKSLLLNSFDKPQEQGKDFFL